jgi:hypothetical protein
VKRHPVQIRLSAVIRVIRGKNNKIRRLQIIHYFRVFGLSCRMVEFRVENTKYVKQINRYHKVQFKHDKKQIVLQK